MKRSEINRLMREAKAFFKLNNFHLPPWAERTPGDWQGTYSTNSEIVDNMLGWDLTDFGSGDFMKRGLLLFTLRNGNPARDKKPYAEKIMIVREEQETPMHFHFSKMEDIIVRGGGRLAMELWGSTPDGQLAHGDLQLRVDGILRSFKAGSTLAIGPGESVCFTQGLYHRFWGEKGAGTVLVGEVSMVNDDTEDNRFLEPLGRFPAIEEDEEPLHLLASDYHARVRKG